MKKFIETNFTTIVLVIALLTLFKSCGDSREISKLRKELETTNAKLDTTNFKINKFGTIDEIEVMSNKVMFDFLIYEDDIDHKKASLSDIKNKINELEKKIKK